MQKLWLSIISLLVGVTTTACSESETENKPSNTSDGTATTTGVGGTTTTASGERITCYATKDPSITYTTTEECQPGFAKVVKVENTGPQRPVVVEL